MHQKLLKKLLSVNSSSYFLENQRVESLLSNSPTKFSNSLVNRLLAYDRRRMLPNFGLLIRPKLLSETSRDLDMLMRGNPQP